MDELLKQCNRCKNLYPSTPTYFYKMPTSRDGLLHRCKKCDNAIRMQAEREKRYYNIPMRCKACEGFFYTSRAKVNKAKKKGTAIKYCSNKCAGKMWIGRGRPSWNGERRGEKNPMAKLKDAQVVLIKRRLREGARIKQVAAEFGISYVTVVGIRSGRTWSHINET